MLISALCDYYDILSRNQKIPQDGYSPVNIHYLVCLTPEGKIDEIVNIQDKVTVGSTKGKSKEKLVPREELLPKRTEKPGIDGNIIEHRPLYIFGLNYDGDAFTPIDRTNKAAKSHKEFVDKNISFIEGLDSPVINAYRAFIENWVPEKETENKFLLELGKNYANSGFVFCLTGRTDLPLHEDEQIRHRWNSQYKRLKGENEDAVISQCAVTGEKREISRIHGKIKGLYGGSATGNVLIGINSPAEESYGKKKSYNSNISAEAMEKYTQALNYLLREGSHKVALDDITVVFWAMSDSENNDTLFHECMNMDFDSMDDDSTEEMLTCLMNDAREGNVLFDRIATTKDIDPDVTFYIAGLKPNVSRISVKFIYRKVFGDVLVNIARHQNDMQISKNIRPIPMWMIKSELISPKSKNENMDPSLLSKIFEAVINGSDYPSFLLSTVIRRIKTDTDIKLNSTRAGIVKACINRRLRLSGKKEELKLYLDKENNNPAYLCGRLFAVLEKLQKDVSGGNLNRTIKDTYFAAAMSKPAMVFPKLETLSIHHMNSLTDKGHKVFYDKLKGEITCKLIGGFPAMLPIQDQGSFIVGYYQQYQDFFVNKQDR